MGDLATDEAGARFADLICADQQWLREEFHALVAANFGAPPGWPRPPAPPRLPPEGSPAGPAVRRAPNISPAATSLRASRYQLRRQRSPPP